MTKAKQKPGKVGTASKPKNRHTKAEQELIVRLIVRLLEQGETKGEIKRIVSKQFGIVARTIEVYISRARGVIAENTGATIAELRNEAYLRLLKVYRSTSNERNKLLAVQGMIDLLGLKMQPGVEPTAAANIDRRQVVRELRADPGLAEYYRQQAAADDAAACNIPRTTAADAPESSQIDDSEEVDD